MPRASTLYTLPETVRDELLQRRAEFKAWTLVDHIEWLKEAGYRISRSALNRYFIEQDSAASQAKVLDQEADQEGRAHALSLMRLRCLEVASRLSESSSKEELLSNARDLLNWVQSVDKP